MRRFLVEVGLVCSLTVGAVAQKPSNPFLGRWDFNVQTPAGMRADWLSVSDTGGKTVVWFQPTGGHVHEVADAHLEGNRLSFTAGAATAKSPGTTWELTASGNQLTGVQKRGSDSVQLTGTRMPELKRAAPKSWGKPQPLFNGQNLDGWEPIGDTANNHWVVKDGVLINEAHGANLRTKKNFEDFKVHFEVSCPDEANSGFYLRGRYEMQLAYEPQKTEPPERSMGAIYGRIPPSKELKPMPNQWEAFDITLVGQTVTIVRNGTTIVDGKEIDGITGGALDANEGEPGPFYIQGDHTGGLKFRNITVAEPKK